MQTLIIFGKIPGDAFIGAAAEAEEEEKIL